MCNGQKYCHGHYVTTMKIKATFFLLWLVSKPNMKNNMDAFVFDAVTNVRNKVKGNFIFCIFLYDFSLAMFVQM